MNVEQLKAHCAALPGAGVRESGPPANLLSYAVDGKLFAYFKTSEPERWRFSLKVNPERFVELTDIPGIKPARWLGHHRWVTIVDVHCLPADYLLELVRWSWRHALSKLPKARRLALDTGSGGAPGGPG